MGVIEDLIQFFLEKGIILKFLSYFIDLIDYYPV